MFPQPLKLRGPKLKYFNFTCQIPKARYHYDSMKSSQANNLLGLPRELRDQILDYVVLTERDVPQPPQHLAGNERTELWDCSYTSGRGTKNVQWKRDTDIVKLGRTRILPTLLVNRQLYSETLTAVHRLPSKHSYKIDVMIVDGFQLWPTWLSLPSPTRYIDNVHATLRTFDLDILNAYRGTGWSTSIGGPPPIAWCFFDLLDRFLKVGPFANARNTPVRIKILNLDVITTNNFDNNTEEDELARSIEDSFNEADSDHLVEFLQTYFGLLLRMDNQVVKYGAIVYEHIGTIRLLRDGEFQQEWDLAECLANLWKQTSHGHPLESQLPPAFETLKEKIVSTRARFSLRVITVEEDASARLSKLALNNQE